MPWLARQGHSVQGHGSTEGCITGGCCHSSRALHFGMREPRCSLSMPSWLTAATNFWCISTDHTTRGFLAAEPSSSRACAVGQQEEGVSR